MIILGRDVEFDKATPICATGGALLTGTLLDLMSHHGYVFKVTHQSDVGSGNSSSLLFTVASSDVAPGHVHFNYEVVTEGEAEVAFYENVTRTTNTGNATTPICINRANPQVSAWGSSSVYKDSTVNTVGATLLDIEVIGNAKAVGGKTDNMFNWSVGRGKTYAVVVNNQSNGANETTIRIVWGRHVEVD